MSEGEREREKVNRQVDGASAKVRKRGRGADNEYEREKQTTPHTCIPLFRFFKRERVAATIDRSCSRRIQVRCESLERARIISRVFDALNFFYRE